MTATLLGIAAMLLVSGTATLVLYACLVVAKRSAVLGGGRDGSRPKKGI